MKNNRFDQVKIKFEKFLALFGDVLTCENDIKAIQNKLRRHFNTATSDYLCSHDFISSLDHIINMFVEKNKSTKYFTLLASFDEQLKKHSIKLSKSNPSSTTASNCLSCITTTNEPIRTDEHSEKAPSPPSTKSTIEYDVSIAEVQATIEHLLDQCCNILSEFDVPNTSRIDRVPPVITTDSNHDQNHQRKIIKLERRLHRLSRIIRELEEKDMSLDEMVHCDLYVVESNLKKQACEIHMKLAKLKSQSSTIERIIHRPITLNESEVGHPLINKDLQEMVNQSKHFPSFSDVLETVEKANDKHKLNLIEETRRTIAEKSFKAIGKEIKTRRMADFQDIMNSRLPEDFNIEQNDPALNDAEIEHVLSENKREAVMKTEKVFEEFSQIEPDPEAEVNIESTEDESANDSEEQQEIEPTVELQEMECDAVDDTPPPSASEPLIPTVMESNSIDASVEIPLNNRTLTILSTASLPIKPTTYNPEAETFYDIPSSPVIDNECKVETLTPRRKQNFNDNEIIYKLYTQRLTNNMSTETKSAEKKRLLTNNMDYSNAKKTKTQQPQQQSEIIVLD